MGDPIFGPRPTRRSRPEPDIETQARERDPRSARAVLSARQQRILQLSLEGWSARDISKELRLSPDRVSDEKYKAICKLRNRLGAPKATAS